MKSLLHSIFNPKRILIQSERVSRIATGFAGTAHAWLLKVRGSAAKRSHFAGRRRATAGQRTICVFSAKQTPLEVAKNRPIPDDFSFGQTRCASDFAISCCDAPLRAVVFAKRSQIGEGVRLRSALSVARGWRVDSSSRLFAGKMACD
jgi:hypothetical protein